jgi:hypothetical protein
MKLHLEDNQIIVHLPNCGVNALVTIYGYNEEKAVLDMEFSFDSKTGVDSFVVEEELKDLIISEIRSMVESEGNDA